jgi:hypothetical protein
MSIHFRTLFEVEIEHGYYQGLCADFDFMVPASEQALAAGKLLTRVRDGRLHVLFEADDAGDPLRDIHGTTLLIGLRVTNPYFANFTDAPVASGGVVLYGNSADPRSLDPALAASFITPRQRISPVQLARPLTLHWQYQGVPLVEQSLGAGQDEANFETRDWPVGRYLLSETAAGPAQASHWLQSPALAGEQLWGVVAVTVDRNFYANSPLFASHSRPAANSSNTTLSRKISAPASLANCNWPMPGPASRGVPSSISTGCCPLHSPPMICRRRHSAMPMRASFSFSHRRRLPGGPAAIASFN